MKLAETLMYANHPPFSLPPDLGPPPPPPQLGQKSILGQPQSTPSERVPNLRRSNEVKSQTPSASSPLYTHPREHQHITSTSAAPSSFNSSRDGKGTSPAHSSSPHFSDQSNPPLSFATTEELSDLRRIICQVIEDILTWIDIMEIDTELIDCVEDIFSKREDCASLLEIRRILEPFPTGRVLYEEKTFEEPLHGSPTDKQKLMAFWKSTDYILWEVKAKIQIVKKYILQTDSRNKLIAIGHTMHKVRMTFSVDKMLQTFPSGSHSLLSNHSTITTQLAQVIPAQAYQSSPKQSPVTSPRQTAPSPLSPRKSPVTSPRTVGFNQFQPSPPEFNGGSTITSSYPASCKEDEKSNSLRAFGDHTDDIKSSRAPRKLDNIINKFEMMGKANSPQNIQPNPLSLALRRKSSATSVSPSSSPPGKDAAQRSSSSFTFRPTNALLSETPPQSTVQNDSIRSPDLSSPQDSSPVPTNPVDQTDSSQQTPPEDCSVQHPPSFVPGHVHFNSNEHRRVMIFENYEQIIKEAEKYEEVAEKGTEEKERDKQRDRPTIIGPPIRKRRTAAGLFEEGKEQGDQKTEKDQHGICGLLPIASRLSGDRRKHLYLQRTKSINKLACGAGITKAHSDKFKELIQAADRLASSEQTSDFFNISSYSYISRVERLREGMKRPYMSGEVARYNKRWKKVLCTLDENFLRIYKTEACDKVAEEVQVAEIVSIGVDSERSQKDEQESIMIILASGKRIVMATASSQENVKWLLAIDGMKDKSMLTTTEKLALLRSRYFIGFKGAFVKSSFDEEWSYNAKTGELISENGVMYGQYPVNVTYVWNGQTLKPFRLAWKDRDNDPSEAPPVFGFGSGVWNGVVMLWYKDGDPKIRLQDFSLMQPEFEYLWDEHDREFFTRDERLRWKFTRHFFASKTTEGHWIIEGELPEPVCLGLQLMRYSRLGVVACKS